MKQRAGVIGIALKLGPKILKFIPQLFKTLKVGKVGLAAGSFAAYSYLLTWQFAIAILVMIGIHEYGHVWAMKRCGMKTKGFYFIPLLGGAAVPEEAFPSCKVEVYVALMGPIWGLGTSLATAGLYYMTSNALFAALAGWMAMVNLFNLLPVYPLDGGRVLRAIGMSLHSWVGKATMIFSLLVSGYAAIELGYGLFWFLLIFGFFDVLQSFGEHKRRIERMNIAQATIEMGKSDNNEFVRKAKEALRKEEGYPMTKPQIVNSVFFYLLLSAVLWYVMFGMNHIPDVQPAMDFLRG